MTLIQRMSFCLKIEECVRAGRVAHSVMLRSGCTTNGRKRSNHNWTNCALQQQKENFGKLQERLFRISRMTNSFQ
jgi:hypothetical protein